MKPRRPLPQSLLRAERKALLLGNAAAQHPQAGELLALSNWIGEQTGATVGYLGEAANSVGAQLVGALPGAGRLERGADAVAADEGLLLLNLEPALDAADPVAADAALQGSGLVVALTAFKDAAVANADVLLPIAPFTETAGSFVNAEGRLQAFNGVVAPLGETRPAWKVLRVLGNLLELPGFDFDSAEQVRAAALGDAATLPCAAGQPLQQRRSAGVGCSRVGPGAHRRRADLCHRHAGAPRRILAAHRRCARAARASCPARLWQQLGSEATATRCACRGTRRRSSCRQSKTPAWRANAVRISAGHAPTRPRWARCSAA